MSNQTEKTEITETREVEVREDVSVDVLALRVQKVIDLLKPFQLRIVSSTPASGRPYIFRMTVEGTPDQLRGFENARLLGLA